MKKTIFLLLLSVVAAVSCGSGSKGNKDAGGRELVYICTGPKSKVYHSTPDCKGLRNCSAEVEKVGREEAEGLGRRPCRICM